MIAHQRANANNPAESGLALCEIEPPAKTIGGQMPCKLYVGNLAHSVSNDDLHQLFSEVGQVQSATVMTDKFSGQSKGFGFVAMTTAEEVANANRQFNDTELKRRNIKEFRSTVARPGGLTVQLTDFVRSSVLPSEKLPIAVS